MNQNLFINADMDLSHMTMFCFVFCTEC